MAKLHFEGVPKRIGKKAFVSWIAAQSGLSPGRITDLRMQGVRASAIIDSSDAARIAAKLDGAVCADCPIESWHEDVDATGAHTDHFRRQLRFIKMEADAELERYGGTATGACDKPTGALQNLVVRDCSTSLGGASRVFFGDRDRSKNLVFHRFRSGAPVLVKRVDTTSPALRGVVGIVESESIEVVLPSFAEPDDVRTTYQISPSFDEIGRGRERTAINRLLHVPEKSRAGELRGILLGESQPIFGEVPTYSSSTTLNSAQEEAIALALCAHDVALIHGPPGTGKTMVVGEIISRAVSNGHSVLATAPSNLAVDNMLERVAYLGNAVIRLGHAARVGEHLRHFGLHHRVENHRDFGTVQSLWNEARKMQQSAARIDKAQRSEITQLRDEARRLEREILRNTLDSAKVLFSTLHGLDPAVLGGRRFDIGIIDEACQATESACWMPVLRCDTLILAGDHCQLPPTILSDAAIAQGADVTMFERLLNLHGPDIARRLDVQYRMHHDIMSFSSHEFYTDSLVANDSVKEALLSDMAHVANTELTNTAVHFIDTAGADFAETNEPGGDSLYNQAEAELTCRKIDQLVAAGIAPSEIAVITPYAAQVRVIRSVLNNREIDVNSVDGFQGRESNVVIISLVRSNKESQIGFLKDVRRLNVALTRARRKLIVIGDSATIGHHEFYSRLLDYFDTIGAYSGIWDEVE